MILCKDIDALLHVISLVDWPKHVKFFFFLRCSRHRYVYRDCKSEMEYYCIYTDAMCLRHHDLYAKKQFKLEPHKFSKIVAFSRELV